MCSHREEHTARDALRGCRMGSKCITRSPPWRRLKHVLRLLFAFSIISISLGWSNFHFSFLFDHLQPEFKGNLTSTSEAGILADTSGNFRTPGSRVTDASVSFSSAPGAGISANFEALFVFTIIRHDLLDLHLASVDYPTDHVFVILNYASDDIKLKMLAVLKKYEKCPGTSERPQQCVNPNINELHVLSSPENIGFSGNCNTGIKAMIEFNLKYAVFSGDDTRFKPMKIEGAKRIIHEHADLCMFHFEAYSSFAITLEGVRKIGPFDENFWPAYAEDCDYWFRSLLVGCSIFYRGGYSPNERSERSMMNAFVEHGDTRDKNLISSVTHNSNPELGRLIQGTLHATRGRFAYLIRKWGLNTCDYYHEVINKWREENEIMPAPQASELARRNAIVTFPYNDSVNFNDTRRWLRDDWKKPGAISSRAVNHVEAPGSLVWQEEDYIKLDSLV